MGAYCRHHSHGSGCSDCLEDCCGCECECECCSEGRRWRCIVSWVLGILGVIAVIVFIVWAVLRPTKPRFYVRNAALTNFNLTVPANLLSTFLQVTVVSHNGNGRVGVYYDRIDVFAAYHDQQITLAASVPGFYQGHDDVNVWSPYLHADAVPVQPDLCLSLQQDEAAGVILLYVKIDAKIRWKVGTWTSGHYRLDVTCPVAFSYHYTEPYGVPAIEYRSSSGCSATV